MMLPFLGLIVFCIHREMLRPVLLALFITFIVLVCLFGGAHLAGVNLD